MSTLTITPDMTIEQKLLAVVSHQSAREATLQSKLHEDLDLDSLDRIDLAVRLEDTFDIDIPDDDVDRSDLGTVSGLLAYLEGRLEHA